jgi:large subunit ribosomal protein L21
MYAIFEDGSRQYRAEPGEVVVLDYREVEVGATLELNKVLLYQNGGETLIGRPLVEGARVVAEVTELTRKKTMIQKFKRRKNYRRLKGHTQHFVRCRVRHVLKAGEQPPAEPQKAEQPKPEQPAAEAPAPAPTA